MTPCGRSLILFIALAYPLTLNAQPRVASDVQSIHVSAGGAAQTPETEPMWQVDDAGVGDASIETHPSEVGRNSSIGVKHKTSNGNGSSVSTTKASPSGAEALLPSQYGRRNFEETASVTVVPDSKLKSHLPELRAGSVIVAKIPHAVIAFPDERTPVIARVTDGALKGENLVGEARLEPNSHRIMIEFKTLTRFDETYHFKGDTTDELGNLGLTGEYHSQEWKLFTGDFIASTVAAYFDGLVPRQSTVFGQVEDNSVDSAAKRGMAGGAMSTAERFRDKLKKTPEFCETKPANIRVLVIE